MTFSISKTSRHCVQALAAALLSVGMSVGMNVGMSVGLSGTAQASLVSSTLHNVVIAGHTYDVAFVQDAGSGFGTSFNEVFGTGTPSFYFNDAASAAVAGTAIWVAVEAANFDPTPLNLFPSNVPAFWLAYGVLGPGFEGYEIWRDARPLYNPVGLMGPFVDLNRNVEYPFSFAVLTATDVPEPASGALAAVALALAALALQQRGRRGRPTGPAVSA